MSQELEDLQDYAPKTDSDPMYQVYRGMSDRDRLTLLTLRKQAAENAFNSGYAKVAGPMADFDASKLPLSGFDASRGPMAGFDAFKASLPKVVRA